MTQWVYVSAMASPKAAPNEESSGGKGANLAEMSNLGLPVPPGSRSRPKSATIFIKHGPFPPI